MPGLLPDVGVLFQQYQSAIYAYLLRLSGRPDMAEDLLQETFYRAIKGAAGFRGEATVITWLCAIAHRLYLDQIRHRAKERARRAEDALPEDLPAPGDLPETTALRAEERAGIKAVLMSLPERERLALLWRDVDGLPYETVAGMLGVSLANAKVIIHRARLRFRQIYLEQKEGFL